jgi:hypothetical protein
MPKLTLLTSLDFWVSFVFCKLQIGAEMLKSFGESGLQAHPRLKLLVARFGASSGGVPASQMMVGYRGRLDGSRAEP